MNIQQVVKVSQGDSLGSKGAKGTKGAKAQKRSAFCVSAECTSSDTEMCERAIKGCEDTKTRVLSSVLGQHCYSDIGTKKVPYHKIFIVTCILFVF